MLFVPKISINTLKEKRGERYKGIFEFISRKKSDIALATKEKDQQTHRQITVNAHIWYLAVFFFIDKSISTDLKKVTKLNH